MTGVEFTGTSREYVAAALRAACPEWTVHARPMTPENVQRDKPVAAVWRHQLTPAANTTTSLDHHLTVNLYASRTSTDALEEELDGELDRLLVALQPLSRVTWTSVDRASWRDGTIAGWRVSLTVTSPNIYKTAHLTKETTP